LLNVLYVSADTSWHSFPEGSYGTSRFSSENARSWHQLQKWFWLVKSIQQFHIFNLDHLRCRHLSKVWHE